MKRRITEHRPRAGVPRRRPGFSPWTGGALLVLAAIAIGCWFGRERRGSRPAAGAAAHASAVPVQSQDAGTPPPVAAGLARESEPAAVPAALPEQTMRATILPASPAGPRRLFPLPVEAGLTPPAIAVPPDPAWRLDHDQVAQYERLGRDFLSATQDPPPLAADTGDAEALRGQWTAARAASDAQFEQLFGSERFAQQQLKGATAAPATAQP